MRRAIIVGGARIADYETIKRSLKKDDYYIFCDSGLYHREGLMVTPSLIIGDFDSHPMPPRHNDIGNDIIEEAPYGQKVIHTRTEDDCEMIVLPHMKDWTDTVYAAMEVIKREYRSAVLIGMSGGRPDHYFSNLSILNMLEKSGIEAWMLDDLSGIRLLIGKNAASIDDECKYFSLLAYDGPAEGVSVKNALYPLEGAVITADDPYAVSNEVLPGRKSEISVERGKLLLVVIYSEDDRG